MWADSCPISSCQGGHQDRHLPWHHLSHISLFLCRQSCPCSQQPSLQFESGVCSCLCKEEDVPRREHQLTIWNSTLWSWWSCRYVCLPAKAFEPANWVYFSNLYFKSLFSKVYFSKGEQFLKLLKLFVRAGESVWTRWPIRSLRLLSKSTTWLVKLTNMS